MTDFAVVPLTEDCPERLRVWGWVRARLETFHPDIEIVTASHAGGVWSKGAAIDAALRRLPTDPDNRLVVMDADVFVAPDVLHGALAAIADGTPWIVPHLHVYRAAKAPTAELLAAPPVAEVDHERLSLARNRYTGVAGGGIVVLTRGAYDTVGPPDPRFVGWGGEDTSWALALDTLVGKHTRLRSPLIHLWHPPQPDARAPRLSSKKLARRYRDARNNGDAMRALLEEVRSCLSPGS